VSRLLPKDDLGRTRLRWAAAAFSGLILWFISPPVNLHFLHWFSFVPIFWALSPTDDRWNVRAGYVSGWLAVFTLFFWLGETVVRFSNIPLPLAYVIVAIFASAFAIPYGVLMGSVHWLRRNLGVWWVLVLPGINASFEKLAPALFPYYQGVSQYRVAATWQLASLIGVIGISYLVLLTNCALAEAVFRRREKRRQPWLLHGTVLALFVANIGFGTWRTAEVEAKLAEAPVLRAAILQQGVSMEERLTQPARVWLDAWVTQTRAVTALKPDLVVWPEGAVPYNPGEKKAIEYFGDLTKKGGYDLLMGGGTIDWFVNEKGEKDYTAYNSAYAFDRDGNLDGRYNKMVPLPFGEYMPGAKLFPFLKEIIQGPGDFLAGTEVTVFHGSYADPRGGRGRYTYTAPICYEAILADQMWKMKDVDLLVNITNDAWFGDTTCPHQHAMLTAVQAIELGRPLLRLAYTGISWVVEPHGAIRYETAPFTDHSSVESIRLGAFETGYRRGGWMFGWVAVAGTAASLLVAVRRSRRTA
jgi:apolipoprotein N-acyltransferase